MPSSGCLVTCLLVLVTSSEGHCPSHCPAYSHPVCGSNGKTYYNECELRRAACHLPILGLLLTKVRDGPCGISISVGNVGYNCPRYCQSDYYYPVCGSDGITYPSECHLKKAACRINHHLTMIHRGACGGSQGHYQECYHRCHGQYDPVCGSDGRTYTNDCWLGQASCKDRSLTLKHRGTCAKGAVHEDHRLNEDGPEHKQPLENEQLVEQGSAQATDDGEDTTSVPSTETSSTR